FGDQGLIPGTPGRGMPPGPISAERPQKSVEDLPLFGQEKAAREAASDRAQDSIFDQPRAEEPARIESERPEGTSPAETGAHPTEELPGAQAPPGTQGSLWDMIDNETGAISPSKLFDGLRKNWKTLRQKFPMEGEVRKRVPNSPVISVAEMGDA